MPVGPGFQAFFKANNGKVAAMHPEGIGKSVLRREDQRLLAGQGQFVADIFIERMKY